MLGHIVRPDRVAGLSPFGHGSDETVAVSILLQIAAQLVSASADLFGDGRSYAAAALVRQVVEVEYLAWAIEAKNGEGERWLRSDKKQRESFFTPAKLRKAAVGKFRGQDYGYHCEAGGHPVPGSTLLLQCSSEVSQLLLSDLLGHAGQIWEHFVGWAKGSTHGNPILKRTAGCGTGLSLGSQPTRSLACHLRREQRAGSACVSFLALSRLDPILGGKVNQERQKSSFCCSARSLAMFDLAATDTSLM